MAGALIPDGEAVPDWSGGAVHGARSAVRRWTADVAGCKSLSECGRPMPGMRVSVRAHDGGFWSPGNLRSCRNRLVCPWCSWLARCALSSRWEAWAEARLAAGWTVLLVVLTVRHRSGEAMGAVRGDLMAGWRRMVKRLEKRRRSMPGAVPWSDEWVWALDVVAGGPDGPHPHLNVLVALPGLLDGVGPVRAALAVEWPRGKWPEGRRPSVRRGVSVEAVSAESVAALSRYAARDARGAAFEAVENRYRTGGGRTLPQIAAAAHGGEAGAGELLRHCAAELAGVRAWGESAAMRASADAVTGGLDPDDVEAVYDRAGRMVGWFDGRLWREHELTLRACVTLAELVRRCGELGIVLQRAEDA